MNGRKRVYISGPMKNVPEHNYPAFDAAAKMWREAGWAVLNPAELSGPNLAKPWKEFIKNDLNTIMSMVDAIALLENWAESEGACIEVLVGLSMGCKFYFGDTMRPMNDDRSGYEYLLKRASLNFAENHKKRWEEQLCFECDLPSFQIGHYGCSHKAVVKGIPNARN